MKRLEKKSQSESDKNLNRQKQKLLTSDRRCEEIDRIIQRLYEDNISGKLADERFAKMSQAYEDDQHQLKESISTMNKALSEREVCFLKKKVKGWLFL